MPSVVTTLNVSAELPIIPFFSQDTLLPTCIAPSPVEPELELKLELVPVPMTVPEPVGVGTPAKSSPLIRHLLTG